MKRIVIIGAVLGLFGIGLVGCHASASVGDNEAASVAMPR
jgi:hypothetical protein